METKLLVGILGKYLLTSRSNVVVTKQVVLTLQFD